MTERLGSIFSKIWEYVVAFCIGALVVTMIIIVNFLGSAGQFFQAVIQDMSDFYRGSRSEILGAKIPDHKAGGTSND